MFKTTLIAAALALCASAFAAGDLTLTDAQIDAAMAKADPDKDGTLDKKEFAAAIVFQFTHANPDNDGTLDPKEAKKAGVKSRKTFETANPDKDGTLDLAEYLAALIAQAK